jgi:radical SAM superfamily enzyme
MARKIAGIFENPGAAEHAKEKLLEAGVALHRIVVSAPANDSVAPPWRSATCVVTVAARSEVDKEQIAQLMLSSGARDTVTPP